MRIVDCYSDLLAFVYRSSRAMPESYASFRDQIEAMLKSGADAAIDKFDADECEQALFAVCAWIDESVMCSNSEQAEIWRSEQLQKVKFETTNGGVEFFTRLNQLPNTYRHARETFYVCLQLGFKGQYVSPTQTGALNAIKHHLLQTLIRDGKELDILHGDALFPSTDSIPPAEKQRTFFNRLNVTTLIVALFPLAVLLALHTTFSYILGTLMDGYSHFLR